MDRNVKPTWRKPFGILAIVLFIALWAVLVASLSPWFAARGRLVETIYYVVAGIIWIFPLRPWLAWMETGRFRPMHGPKSD